MVIAPSPVVSSHWYTAPPAQPNLPTRTCGNRTPGASLLPRGRLQILDLVLLHLRVQRGAVEPEDGGRFLLVPVGPLKGLQNGHSLDFGQRAVRRDDELGTRAAFLPNRFGEIAGPNLAALRHQHAAPRLVF